MAVLYNPSIVTDGLVLCLDAANPKSYPGSGTTWRDLSGNGNNLDIFNGPIFSPTNSGYFSFDGIDEYASKTGTLSGITNYNNFSVVVAFKSSTRKSFMALIGDDVHNASYAGYTTELNEGSLSMYSNGSLISTTEKYDDGNWHIATITMKTGSSNCVISVDNTPRITGTLPTPTLVNTSFMVASWGQSSYNYSGIISYVQIYNRTLNATEISQNFNALRGRFGI